MKIASINYYNNNNVINFNSKKNYSKSNPIQENNGLDCPIISKSQIKNKAKEYKKEAIIEREACSKTIKEIKKNIKEGLNTISDYKQDTKLNSETKEFCIGYNKDEQGNITASRMFVFENGELVKYYENYTRSNLGLVTSLVFYDRAQEEFYTDYKKIPAFSSFKDSVFASTYCTIANDKPAIIRRNYASALDGFGSTEVYKFNEDDSLALCKKNDFHSYYPDNKIKESCDEIVYYSNEKPSVYAEYYLVDNHNCSKNNFITYLD